MSKSEEVLLENRFLFLSFLFFEFLLLPLFLFFEFLFTRNYPLHRSSFSTDDFSLYPTLLAFARRSYRLTSESTFLGLFDHLRRTSLERLNTLRVITNTSNKLVFDVIREIQ